MDILFQPENLLSLLSLTLLEIVLGLDNVIFISILVSKLPASEQAKGRNLSLFIALLLRLGFLSIITWITQLESTLFSIFSNDLSGKDLIMLSGGVFLMFKSVSEIHSKLEGENHDDGVKASNDFWIVIVQSIALSFIFSIDSIITAIGLSNEILVMAIAIIVSTIIMIAFAGSLDRFIQKHPTMKMLGLALLLLIGVLLVAEAFDVHVPKGYMYFAIAFALLVETLNIQLRKKSTLIDRTISSGQDKHK